MLNFENSFILINMSNLALILIYQNKYERAEEMHQKILKLRKKMLDSEHSFILISMSNLILTFMYQKKYERAEKINQQILKLKKKY